MKKVLKEGQYEYLESDRLGKGSFGQVFKGRVLKTGEVVAIKIISMKILAKYGQEIKKVISSEVSVMVKLSNRMKEKSCPFIVRIVDCFRTQTNIYMILEYCGEGDLEKYIGEKGRLSEEQSLTILYQICKSLEFLAENGVTHRDLKPQNVFMKKQYHNGQKQTLFKLGDFGFAAQKKTFSTTLGTYPYMAPELFQSNSYDSAVDVWALGIMAFQLVFGDIYFMGNDQWDIKKKVLTIEFKLNPKQKQEVSSQFEDFMIKCLIKDRNKRLKADQLCSHPVFKRIREKELEVPPAVKASYNNYFVKTIKQLVYKSVFLAEVSKAVAETGRKALFASIYMAKKAYCYIHHLDNKLTEKNCPFEFQKNSWLVFTSSKDYRDACQFVASVKNNIQQFFKAFYQQFQVYLNKFAKQDQTRINQIVSTIPTEDINSNIYQGEVTKWRKEFDALPQFKVLALECLLASKVDLITTYDFEKHINQRKTLTEESLRQKIQKI